MPMFHYEATDQSGKTLVGSMDARDEGAVRVRLAQDGYTPLLIETATRPRAPKSSGTVRAMTGAPPVQQGSGSGSGGSGNGSAGGAANGDWKASRAGDAVTDGPGARGADGMQFNLLSGNLSMPAKGRRRAGVVVPSRALAQFYRQMAAMLKSGVPITQALPQLAAGERNRVLRAALQDMETSVANGRPLSEAMARHPRAFSPGHVGLVHSGEVAGFMDRAMEELAVQVEANWGLQNQFNLTVLYGKLLLVPFFIAFLYLMAHVGSLANAPGDKFVAVLRLAGVSALVGLGASAIINGVVPLLWRALRGTSFGGNIDSLVARAPLIGAVRRKSDRVRTLSSLGSSLTAGLPLYTAWNLASEAAETAYTRQQMEKYSGRLNQGEPLPDVMAATRLYSNNTMQLVRSGDLAGNLPEMLTRAAGYEREEVNFETKRNSTVYGFVFILVIILVVAAYIIKFWLGYFLGAGGLMGGGAEGFLSLL